METFAEKTKLTRNGANAIQRVIKVKGQKLQASNTLEQLSEKMVQNPR